MSSCSEEGTKMNKIEASQLSHPELLSEVKLREILENSCIVLPAFGTLSKEELIEIFKRIALPMSQRRYNESRPLGKTLNNLRAKKGVKTAVYSENSDLPSATSRLADDTKNESCRTGDVASKNRLKPPISDSQQISKKIRLSNSCDTDIVSDKDAKRKCEVSSLPDLKKRQKITWP